LQDSRGPETRSLPVVNVQFSDKRNAANGTLWTDTIYKLQDLLAGFIISVFVRTSLVFKLNRNMIYMKIFFQMIPDLLKN